MNATEFYVLEAVNIASTRYRRPKHDFEATAAQIAEIFNDPRERERLEIPGDFYEVDARWVGSQLGQLAKTWPDRRAPLVEKVDTRRWHLTDAGLGVLIA